MARVTMYSTRICPYCVMAEKLLAKKGVSADKVMLDDEPARRDEMVKRSGRTTVPQIFIGERHVGGYTDLAALDLKGELEPLLRA